MHEGLLLSLVLKFGYPAIFFTLALGMFGLPVPDETLMLFSGYLVSLGLLRFPLVVLFCYLGSLTGITLSFFIGRRPASSLLQRYGKRIGVDERKTLLLAEWLKRYGGFGLAVGYFIPGVRHLMFFTAGIGKMPFKRFARAAYPSGLFWVMVSVGAGTVLGEEWGRISGIASVSKYLVLVLLLGIFLLLVVRGRRRPGPLTPKRN